MKAPELLRRVAFRVTPPPGGVPMAQDAQCCLCGRNILKGEFGAPASFGAQFSDGAYLYRSSKGPMSICGECVPSMSQEVMRTVKAVLLTSEGLFPFFERSHRAFFLLHPPKPPFVVLLGPTGGTSSSHLVWKAPLSWDENIWYIQTPLTTMVLDRQRALALHKTLSFVVKSLNDYRVEQVAKQNAGRKKGQKKISAPKPIKIFQLFLKLDDSLAKMRNGAIAPQWRKMIHEVGLDEHIQFVENSLGYAEIIALAALDSEEIPKHRPERIYVGEGGKKKL